MVASRRAKLLLQFLAAVLFGAFAAACSTAAQTSDPVPEHLSFKMRSAVLNEERTINIWTPRGYAESRQDYPVLYMLDGGIKEDFPHIANTLAELSRSGAIAPIVLVGIQNTERRRDLTPSSTTEYDRKYAPMTDGASPFRRFIREGLFPEIGRRLRVTEDRAVVGESVAGLFVIDTLMREPDLFDRYIAMDPALWWDDHRIVRQAKTTLPRLGARPKKLWFAGSGAEDIRLHTQALAEILEESGPATLTLTYAPRPKEKHNTIFRATKAEAFRWALPSKQ